MILKGFVTFSLKGPGKTLLPCVASDLGFFKLVNHEEQWWLVWPDILPSSSSASTQAKHPSIKVENRLIMMMSQPDYIEVLLL